MTPEDILQALAYGGPARWWCGHEGEDEGVVYRWTPMVDRGDNDWYCSYCDDEYDMDTDDAQRDDFHWGVTSPAGDYPPE